jgi:hypothetical protein
MLSLGYRLLANYEGKADTEVYTTLVTCIQEYHGNYFHVWSNLVTTFAGRGGVSVSSLDRKHPRGSSVTSRGRAFSSGS